MSSLPLSIGLSLNSRDQCIAAIQSATTLSGAISDTRQGYNEAVQEIDIVLAMYTPDGDIDDLLDELRRMRQALIERKLLYIEFDSNLRPDGPSTRLRTRTSLHSSTIAGSISTGPSAPKSTPNRRNAKSASKATGRRRWFQKKAVN